MLNTESPPTADEEFDVIVLGGGPAGSTLATLVAMQNHRVLLLERERFPRYHIGEGLLPGTVHGIGSLLGVRDELLAANFMRKDGGSFRWGTKAEPWNFRFDQSVTLSSIGFTYSYQVERSKFDHILLNNARRKGVDVREQHAVTDVLLEGDRAVGVRFTEPDGEKRTAKARYVVDASGQRSPFHKHAGERVTSKFFQNVALFCYYRDGKRQPAPRQGNGLGAAFDCGWFWYIPLSDTITSVGVVISHEHFEKLKRPHEEAMQDFIDSCPIIKDYLSEATRVTEGDYGKFRVIKDYSYCNTKFWMPGMVLIGDAACFVDPLFSTGVHLATYSGLLAARSINTCLGNQLDEAPSFEEFEKRYRIEYNNFHDFLVSFYDLHQEKDSYFWMARKVLNCDEPPSEAFARLAAGDCSQFGSQADHAVPRTFQAMVNVTETERAQIALQAHRGEDRPAEAPLFEGGLVPSKDGLHWMQAATA